MSLSKVKIYGGFSEPWSFREGNLYAVKDWNFLEQFSGGSLKTFWNLPEGYGCDWVLIWVKSEAAF